MRSPTSPSWSLVFSRLVSNTRGRVSSVEKAACGARRSSFNDSSSSSFFSTSTSTSSSPSSSSSTLPQQPVVAFVGLGAMGSRIARRLSRTFPLIACDSSKAAVDTFLAEKPPPAPSPSPLPPPHSLASALSVAELFDREDPPSAVLTSLPSPAAVRDVWLGEEGLIRKAADAAASSSSIKASRSEKASSSPVLLVELSTIEPQTALELAAAVARENKASKFPLHFLSAPVSGGTAAAANGTLTVLVGGPLASLELASPFLSAFSARVIHAGKDSGDGDAAKLANNLALAIQMCSVSEALSLASRLAPQSLTPQKMIEILNECSGKCWSSEVYPPLPEMRNNYRGGFAASLMLKDLKLAKKAAAAAAGRGGSGSLNSSSSSASSLTPLADAATAAYRSCPASDDFSSVFRHFYGGGER